MILLNITLMKFLGVIDEMFMRDVCLTHLSASFLSASRRFCSSFFLAIAAVRSATDGMLSREGSPVYGRISDFSFSGPVAEDAEKNTYEREYEIYEREFFFVN